MNDDAIKEIREVAEDRRRIAAERDRRYRERRQRALELLFYIQTHGVMTEESLEYVIFEIAAAEERGLT